MTSKLATFLNVNLTPKLTPFETVSANEQGSFSQLLVQYLSNDGDLIPAYLLLPRKPSGAAILVHHQHNGERHFGKSEVVGLAGNVLQAFGPALAENGFIVLAPDSICFEDRRPNAKGTECDDEGDFLQHFNEMTYRLIKGDTLMRKVLEDASTGLSVLLSIEGVDPTRVGVLGHSYGGNTTLFQTALDQRIQFACASGAVCSYKNKMERGTGLEFSLAIPDIFNHFDFTDILSSVGPRPFLVVSADEDKYAQDADIVVEDCKKRLGPHSETLQHFRYRGGHPITVDRFDAIVKWFVQQGKRD
ncbi:MAG: acetylxylan esterase [Bdellovibrionales bacterium]|jgi:cephalosporin-C deacetylase-like acetyl esterase|nr:acetylxylan esterase [Bdellovibrionales bacterium]